LADNARDCGAGLPLLAAVKPRYAQAFQASDSPTQETNGETKMFNMMGGGMMAGMGIVGALCILLVALVVAALVKYLFFSKRD
jgi:hypothetical protein